MHDVRHHRLLVHLSQLFIFLFLPFGQLAKQSIFSNIVLTHITKAWQSFGATSASLPQRQHWHTPVQQVMSLVLPLFKTIFSRTYFTAFRVTSGSRLYYRYRDLEDISPIGYGPRHTTIIHSKHTSNVNNHLEPPLHLLPQRNSLDTHYTSTGYWASHSLNCFKTCTPQDMSLVLYLSLST